MPATTQTYEDAIRLHRSGNLAGAEQLCTELIAADPFHLHGNYLLAIIRLQQGRHEEALAVATTMLMAYPEAVDALIVQGVAYQSLERFQDALACYDRALEIRPELEDVLWRRATVLDRMGNGQAAFAALDHVLKLRPEHGEALKAKGNLLLRLGRPSEALIAYDAAISFSPGDAELHNGRGVALGNLERQEEALVSFKHALEVAPGRADVMNNRGKAFLSLEQLEQALADFDKAIELDGRVPEPWMNRGIVLWRLQRPREAVESHDAALALAPDNAEIFYHRANAQRALAQYKEAENDYRKALILQSEHEPAWYNLGATLCEQRRLDDGFEVFMQWATLLSERGDFRGLPPERHQHDLEQQTYRMAHGLPPIDPTKLHTEGGQRLASRAINHTGAAAAEARWNKADPKILVIDNLLTPEALTALRTYCWGSTIWRKLYGNYIGAFPEHGFCCPLLAQIAAELSEIHPLIFRDHPLLYLWAFKYGSGRTGTGVHADFAAVNVNFWITPDEANLDPESGGLIIWPVPAPADWDFSRYNRSGEHIRQFLSKCGAEPIKIPYRANRAVIFDSDLFHETNQINFDERCRRINITFLYGRRNASN